MIESQLRLHGIEPAEGMILVEPRPGEHILRTEDIVAKLREGADSIALVLFCGVQYYTGQYFDMKTIAAVGHEIVRTKYGWGLVLTFLQGAAVGFDLAHAVGNVPLKLHDLNVDFAAWCSYKYLNAGPGAIAGVFVHNRHDHNEKLTILRGWWGHKKATRFLMNNRTWLRQDKRLKRL